MTPQVGDLLVGKWGARYRGRQIPCAIGRGGIGIKRGEGDGVTPVGAFQIAGLGFRADRMAPPDAPVTPHMIGPNDIWSDDPDDPDYNHGLAAWNHPFRHEAMHRADLLYDLFAVLNFNWPVSVPGKGSAIFLHIWRKARHPTEGCVAFSRRDFRYILATWHRAARVIIRA